MTYIDSDGKAKTPIMGCYGIGVGRLLACIIEASHDDYGPIWPISVAPWQIHIISLKSKNMNIDEIGMNLYQTLQKQYEVIYDERNLGPGAKFADADLLGVPIRIVLGEKNLKNGEVELMTRDKSVKKNVKLENIVDEIQTLFNELNH